MPSLNRSPLAPFGPSVVLMDGMPFEEIGTVLQKSLPPSRDTLHLQHVVLHQYLYCHTCSSKDRPAAMRRASSLRPFSDNIFCPVNLDFGLRVRLLPNVDLVAKKEEEETPTRIIYLAV